MPITENKLQSFGADLNQLIAESHNPPPTGDDAIKGMDRVRDLYLSHKPTERNGELVISLLEVLLTNYPEFDACCAATAQALDQK